MARYPWELLPKLVVQIELCRAGAGPRLLDRLLDIVFEDRRKGLN